jgi:hypothetical protein
MHSLPVAAVIPACNAERSIAEVLEMPPWQPDGGPERPWISQFHAMKRRGAPREQSQLYEAAG